MKNILNRLLILFTVTGLAFSCDNEDFTGDSELTPTSPSISVSLPSEKLAFTESADSVWTFTVTLSTPQIVDVAVYVTQTAGNATMGDDYTVTERLVIPAYRSTASGVIAIIKDDAPEDDESFTLQFGSELTGNSAITPVSLKFDILNYSDDALEATLSWSTNFEEVFGFEKSATDVADMELIVLNVSDGSTDVVDGSGFETYDGFADLDDGEYLLGAAFYSTIDLGDINEPVSMSFAFEFFQSGVINGLTMQFPNLRENTNACEAVVNYMVKVTKVGATYTFEEAISEVITGNKEVLYGDLSGYDGRFPGLGYTSPGNVEVSFNGTDLLIDGLNQDFILNVWGEEVQTQVPVKFTLDVETLVITIPEQYIFTTLYDGSLYDYNIVGTGTLDDVCGGAITLDYEMIQDGFEVGAWLNANGYSDDPIFHAVLSK